MKQFRTHTIDLYVDLSVILDIEENELSNEIKRLAIIKLYEMEKISSAKAAKILSISRISFFDMLSQYKIDIYNDSDSKTLIEDRKNAKN